MEKAPAFFNCLAKTLEPQLKKTSGQYLTDDFMNENQFHHHGRSGYSSCTGHFTQVAIAEKEN